ncbi:hypothetical protein [Aurantiacibacter sediminis]|uniref:Translation initiation factor 2 n=1 Tax=Aurantiacibacter sediminis TaxID=2793064 RepID=A0ABS0N5N9_9SPHN|nr:hypothetical protein [Aurantiacibacter sediminis]MBH5323114.1 hypothetical protein [Aurantiacibacter sediminis]
MNLKFASAIAIASISLSGCATVLNGTNQPVEFESEPAGAVIETLAGQTCTTPCAFEMRRGDDSMVTFTAAGYEPVTVYIQSRTGGGVAGNILAGGLIGGVVDASNGASNHLYPDPVYIRMAPVGSGEPALMLDKDGEIISTVAEYNAEVAEDVREGIVEQGLYATVDDVPPAD